MNQKKAQNTTKKIIKYTLLGCLGIIGILILIIYLGRDESLEINHYKVTSKKVTTEIRIVQISDLHSTKFGENQKELLSNIRKQSPDLIFITGDVLVENGDLTNCRDLFKEVVKIAPTYYVTGNHEYRDKNPKNLFKILDTYNIIKLFDENKEIKVKDNIINISGLDDSEGNNYWNRNKKDIERLEKIKYNNKYLSLLLSHRPELVDSYSQTDYDVIFTGHAHGGQVRIPGIIAGVIAPNQGLFPKYTKGVYDLNKKTKMIVSAGLAVNNVARLNNRPDLVVVSILPEKEEK